MKVMIAVPCMDTVPAVFTECLVGLMKPEGTVLVTARSSLIYDARNLLAKMAIDKGFDRILWLDSDMVFGNDLLLRLMNDMDGKHGWVAYETGDDTAVPSSDGWVPSGANADTVKANIPDAENSPKIQKANSDKNTPKIDSPNNATTAAEKRVPLGHDITFPRHVSDSSQVVKPRYVSGLYFTRKNPIKPVAYKETGFHTTDAGLVPYCDPIDGDYGNNDLMQVAATGLGGCLMDVKLLQEVYSAFGLPFSPQQGFGEDLSFCRRLEEMGIPMYLDTGVKMGHVAQTVVGEEQYRSGYVL